MEPGACNSESILSVSALWNLWCQDVCFPHYVFNRRLLSICSLNAYLLKATWKVVEIAFWSDLWAPGLNFILIQRVIMINHKQGSLLVNTVSLCLQLISFLISLSYSLPPHFESLFLWEKCYSIYPCERKLSHFVFQTRSVWFEKVWNCYRNHLSDSPWVTEVVPGRIRCVCELLSHVPLFDLTVCSPPASSVHWFSRQEYWCGLQLPSQGIFLTQGLNPRLLHYQEDSSPLSHPGSPPGRIRSQQSPLMANPSEQQPRWSKPVGSCRLSGASPSSPLFWLHP